MKKVGILVLAFMASFGASATQTSIADQITNVCTPETRADINIVKEVREAYEAYKNKFNPDPNVDDAALPNDKKCFGNVRDELYRLHPEMKKN